MKKTMIAVFAVALILAMLFALAGPASAFKAQRSTQTLNVDGKVINCDKYNIDDENYFKLRDMASLLNGTGSQFDVSFDEATWTVVITTNKAYAKPDGTELKIGRDADTVEGSLILTVKSEYLDTLSEGEHTVTLAFANGTVETALKVKAAAPAPTKEPQPEPTKEPQPGPKTGDASDLLLWGGLVILGIIGMAAVTAGRRRKE